MDNLALYSLEAEHSVLGILLTDRHAFDHIAEAITEHDFVNNGHGLIYRAIAALANAGKAYDALTVYAALQEGGNEQAVGGLGYIGDLAGKAPASANLRAYADVIRHRAQLRHFIQTFDHCRAVIANTEVQLQDKAEQCAELLLGSVANLREGQPVKSAREVAAAWLDNLDQTFKRGTTITGIRTGFPDLDHLLRGLHNKHLTIIAARPSVGKSTLLTNIARNILHDGGSVAFFTMEMSAEDVTHQLCACHTGVSYEAIQNARMGCEEVQAATGAFVAAMRDWRLSIDDRGTQTVASVRAAIKRHIRIYKVKPVVMVDYAQLMQAKGENETVRIGEISRGLKQLAQDMDLPVILLSQLNRQGDSRGDSRPRLTDLRGSGSLEQDASEVLFLHDEAANNPDLDTGITELIIAKNRHGRRGVTLPLLKQLDRARFLPAVAENWQPTSYKAKKKEAL